MTPFQLRARILLRVVMLAAAAACLGSAAHAQAPHDGSVVMAQVDIGSGGGGSSGVTFSLFKIQAGCCNQCKVPPVRPCRKCCYLLKDASYSVTLNESGPLKFENVEPGLYLAVNEADGKPAGLEQMIEVKEKSKTNLGKLVVDDGRRPRGAAGDKMLPREP